MNIIVLIAVVIVSILVLARIINYAGIPIPLSGRIASLILSKKNPSNNQIEPVTKKDTLKICAEALIFRIAIYILSYLILELIYMQDQSFLEWWYKWDASNYVSIATSGYKGIVLNGISNMGDNVYQTLVFFPLYPWFMRAINLLIHNMQLSALITSTLCYVGGCAFIYHAVALRFKKSIAEKTVILLSVFPFAFFNGAMMPESTFLLLGGACLYFTFKHKWWFAGICGALASLSRLQGILLLGFMGVEWLEEYQVFALLKNKNWKDFRKKLILLIPVCLPIAGTGIYLLLNFKNTGDAFYFMKLQENVWSHSFENIGSAIQTIWDNLFASNIETNLKLSVYLPHVIIFFFTLYMIVRCLRSNRNSLSAFLLVYLVISFSTNFLVSGGRYMSIAIPLFIAEALLCEEHPAYYKWFISIGLLFMVVFMGCYLSGTNMVA